MNKSNPKLLYVAEAVRGGIAEYSAFQIAALADSGLEVWTLCRPESPLVGREKTIPHLPDTNIRSLPHRFIGHLADLKSCAKEIDSLVRQHEIKLVLLDCFKEYFAPFWVKPLLKLAQEGVTFGVVAHDPVRDFVVGPAAWHRYCIREAYSFVRHVFVHDPTKIDFGGEKPACVQIHSIPHGPYPVSKPTLGRRALRADFGFLDSDVVFLAFGQIRDSKHLDAFMRIMPDLPSKVKLLVVGNEQSGTHRTASFYQEYAEELGVAERCRWEIRYVDSEEIANFFKLSEFIVQTYGENHYSASGVL